MKPLTQKREKTSNKIFLNENMRSYGNAKSKEKQGGVITLIHAKPYKNK